MGRQKRSSNALLAEVFVEVVEDRAAASEPFLVSLVRHRDAVDQSLYAAGLLPSELAVLQVYVVDDFGDRLERWERSRAPCDRYHQFVHRMLWNTLGSSSA
jgi:hypothetical protein